MKGGAGDPLMEWVGGARTEVGSVAPSVGEEPSECSNAAKKSQFSLQGATPIVVCDIRAEPAECPTVGD